MTANFPLDASIRCAVKIPMPAAVLAGGASRRMGVPKASLPYGRTTLLAHHRILAECPAPVSALFLNPRAGGGLRAHWIRYAANSTKSSMRSSHAVSQRSEISCAGERPSAS